MEGRALAGSVSTREPYAHGDEGGARIAVLDYGCKRSILTQLAAAGAQALVYPHDTPAEALLEAAPDGVLLSNGPGDPAALDATRSSEVRKLLGRVPLLGICLGHQLLALATGHETFKLRFGHRGANHPGAGTVERAGARHEPEPRLRRPPHGRPGGDARLALRRHRRGARRSRRSGRARSSSTPRPAPGPHDARPLHRGWVEEVGLAQAA